MPQLWLPRSFTREEPKYACRLCGDRFYEVRELQRHVKRCYTAREAEIREQSPREAHPGLFGDQNVDVEWERFHRVRGVA